MRRGASERMAVNCASFHSPMIDANLEFSLIGTRRSLVPNDSDWIGSIARYRP